MFSATVDAKRLPGKGHNHFLYSWNMDICGDVHTACAIYQIFRMTSHPEQHLLAGKLPTDVLQLVTVKTVGR